MAKMRFSRLLLAGKAATLPLLIGQVKAATVTPGYSDMISTNLSIIEMPSGDGIQLNSITSDAGIATSPYGTSSYAASMCTNFSLPSNMSMVVTGVMPGDTVYVVAASDKNDSLHIQADSRLTVGRQNLTILGIVGSAGSQIPFSASQIRSSIVLDVSSSSLTRLAVGGRFYIQAVVASGTGQFRFSELDEIAVGTCQASTYGTGTTYVGGIY
ncbi:MAG: hypothetical protein Q8O25_05520 [Sulfurisoma sp.]|nr:hypothetical protein [Sulfurisoma sp.]